VPRKARQELKSAGELKGELRVLNVVAQYPRGVTREQLMVLAGYKRSSLGTYLQRLIADGAIERGAAGRFLAMRAGIDRLGASLTVLPKGAALREHWLDRLPAGESSILATLILHADGLDRASLMDLSGYKRSSLGTYLQRLKARELIQSGSGGVIVASPALFVDRT